MQRLYIVVSIFRDLFLLPFFWSADMLRACGVLGLAYEEEVRQDPKTFEVQKGVEIVVYWKSLRIGRGPTICLFINNREILKFDCLGTRQGHYHMTTVHPWQPRRYQRQIRLWLYEQKVEDQVNRSIYELDRNLYFYLQRHTDPRIRWCQIDMDKLRKILPEARKLMLKFVQNMPDPKV